MALIMAFVLWVSNMCLGRDGWFSLWTGIEQIFAHTAAFCVFVAQWIWTNTAALGVSFGKELYAQLAVEQQHQDLPQSGNGVGGNFNGDSATPSRSAGEGANAAGTKTHPPTARRVTVSLLGQLEAECDDLDRMELL